MKINIGSMYFLLVIILIILKIANILNINWIWVFSPLWIPLLFIIAVLGAIYVFYLFVLLIIFLKG